MGKTSKEMQEELKRIRDQEHEKKMQAERAELEESRKLARAKSSDDLMKGRYFTDPQSGRQVEHWDEAKRKADAAVSAEVMSYNDWRAAMMGLLTMYSSLTSALHQSFKETVTAPLSNIASDYVILPLSDKVKGLFTGNPELDLPLLQHCVQLGDDGKLKIDPLTRSDNVNETGMLDKLFEKGIHLWLEKEGYKPDPADKDRFLDVNGVPFKDAAAFNALKNDPDKGINHFLTEYSELEFRPTGPGR